VATQTPRLVIGVFVVAPLWFGKPVGTVPDLVIRQWPAWSAHGRPADFQISASSEMPLFLGTTLGTPVSGSPGPERSRVNNGRF